MENDAGYKAEIVKDSISNQGIRLTTVQLRYPRMVHQELLTHRVFSRNASSSRAVPVNKFIDEVLENPAMPREWGKNQKGMQAYEQTDAPVPVMSGRGETSPEQAWAEASEVMVGVAENFASAGYHKQVVNRLLEPFQFIDVVVTATEWDNFFNLRTAPTADPTIREIALLTQQEINNSTPKNLSAGRWHLPYVSFQEENYHGIEVAKKLSAARLARVSYKNHDGSDPDVDRDIKLHDMLYDEGHESPFEHIARPMTKHMSMPEEDMFNAWEFGVTHVDSWCRLWSGNFHGWVQYRQQLDEE